MSRRGGTDEFLGRDPAAAQTLSLPRARDRRRRVVTDAVAEPSICVWCSFADTHVRSSPARLNAPRSKALEDQPLEGEKTLPTSGVRAVD